MPTLLSHNDLKISYAEYGALIATRTMIACGALKFMPRCVPQANVHGINMGVTCSVSECGSVGCIGGNMGLLMGMAPDKASHYVLSMPERRSLHPLFFPHHDAVAADSYGIYEDITATQVLAAVDNFLTTGRPKWATVLRLQDENKDKE